MGLRFRKSIKLAKGVRLNFGTSGASVSVGAKGCRYSMHTSGRHTVSMGIPGTGVYYTKTLRSGKKGGSLIPGLGGLTGLSEGAGKNVPEEGAASAAAYQDYMERIRSVHKECEKSVDWEAIIRQAAPFAPGEKGPEELAATQAYESFKPGFFENIFGNKGAKRRQDLYDKITLARQKDEEAYSEWEEGVRFAKSISENDIDAYLEVIHEAKPFEDLLEYGSNFEFGTDEARAMTVEFQVKAKDVVPEKELSLTKTGKVSEKELSKTRYFAYLQDYVCSCSIRVARELFALLPLDKVVVHAVDARLNEATGRDEECTILSVRFYKKDMEGADFDRIDPSAFIENTEHHMDFKKNAGFMPVDNIE